MVLPFPICYSNGLGSLMASVLACINMASLLHPLICNKYTDNWLHHIFHSFSHVRSKTCLVIFDNTTILQKHYYIFIHSKCEFATHFYDCNENSIQILSPEKILPKWQPTCSNASCPFGFKRHSSC